MDVMRQPLCWLLAAGLFVVTAGLYPLNASADIVGTEQFMAEQQAELDRARILDSLEREDVREQLTAHGVDPANAEERVAGMTDEEVQKLAADMDQMPAGGDVSLVGVLLIVILVILIT